MNQDVSAHRQAHDRSSGTLSGSVSNARRTNSLVLHRNRLSYQRSPLLSRAPEQASQGSCVGLVAHVSSSTSFEMVTPYESLLLNELPIRPPSPSRFRSSGRGRPRRETRGSIQGRFVHSSSTFRRSSRSKTKLTTFARVSPRYVLFPTHCVFPPPTSPCPQATRPFTVSRAKTKKDLQ